MGGGELLLAQQTRKPGYEPRMVGFFQYRAFPDGDDVPSALQELVFFLQVAGFIGRDFLFPPCGVGFRYVECRAVFVSAPEASVDEDHGSVFREDDVRFARQKFVAWTVDRESVAEAVEHRAQCEFRLRVPAPD